VEVVEIQQFEEFQQETNDFFFNFSKIATIYHLCKSDKAIQIFKYKYGWNIYNVDGMGFINPLKPTCTISKISFYL